MTTGLRQLAKFLEVSHFWPTRSQFESYQNLCNRYNKEPLKVYSAFHENCLMVQYDFITIGIEPTGEEHS